jgi:AcrR family transcriptional regulator
VTKEKIIKTALIHFAQKGYENTSMNEIANDLNISKPALYYHFKNKQELYNEIFKYYFEKLKFKKQHSLEEDINHYINVFGGFFINNPLIAKLFAKELACEGEHLTEDTLKITSKTIKFLYEILPKKINPFFIQTMIISAFTTYSNTINLRAKVSKIVNFNAEFNIVDEIKKAVISYIKAHT